MTRPLPPNPPDDEALLARLVLDDKPGPAARISSARAHAMVDAALDAALLAGAASTAAASTYASQPAAATTAARGAWGWLAAQPPLVRAAAMAAAGVLAVAGGVAAARLAGFSAFGGGREPAPAVPVGAPAQPVAPATTPVPAAPAPAEALDADDATREPSGPEPRAARHAREPREVRDGALEDLLQQANRARADGDFREAADLYAQVYEGRPSSLSAYVALVAAASLELEHLDRPARARKLFEAALRARPNGALDLEARQGLALALRDLGARADEVAALRKLIAMHPARPAAARARARLAELGE